jgi:hypothetical protein
MCAARTCEEDGFRFRGAWQGRSAGDRRAHTHGWGALAADDFGPALRRNGSDAELGKMDEIDQDEQRNSYARASWSLTVEPGQDVGIRADIAKPSQGPAPVCSQEWI